MTNAAIPSGQEPAGGDRQAPVTGNPAMDAALQRAATETDDPGELLAALSAAHQAVADLLTASPTDQSPIPGVNG